MNKKATFSLGILQLFVAILAIPAGLSFIFESDGSGIGLSSEILQQSPFSDFFIPGLFLLAGNGYGHLTGAVFSFTKSTVTGIAGITLGIFLLIWIIVQVYFTGITHFLQPLFFAVAIAEIILAVIVYSEIKNKNNAS